MRGKRRRRWRWWRKGREREVEGEDVVMEVVEEEVEDVVEEGKPALQRLY